MSSVPDPRDPMLVDRYSYTDLPDWVEAFRPNQWDIVEEIVEAFMSGKKYVMLDAPTGAGKTLIAEVVRRRLGVRALYSCTTKTLQEQFSKDFGYAQMLKGRENYPTLNFPDAFGEENPNLRITAADCNKRWEEVAEEDLQERDCDCNDEDYVPEEDPDYVEETDATSDGEEIRRIPVCDFCHSPDRCPYRMAKATALRSSLVCMNTAYLMTECNGPGQFSGRFNLAICDEADLLENQLMNFVEVNVSSKVRRELGIEPPYIKSHTAKGAYESWQGWCRYAIVRVKQRLAELPKKTTNVRVIRERKSLDNLLKRLEKVAEEVVGGGWVYTGYTDAPDHPIIFRPVWVHGYAPGYLWCHADRWLLMSATMLSGDLTARELGMEEGKHTLISMPSSFPKENRPIFYVPKADMAQKNIEQARPVMVGAIEQLMDRYPDERILVHTVSYDLAQYLYQHCRDPRGRVLTYRSAKERNDTLLRYRENPASVVLAPSFERGVDLKDDDCRVVVIAKVPYPYLGDKQVNARLHSPGGPEWYHLQTIRSIVQMSGRGVRHDRDWADTYILDSQFYRLWKERRRWFPRWWAEAIIWNDKPQLQVVSR